MNHSHQDDCRPAERERPPHTPTQTDAREGRVVLRLYVAGNAPRSVQALANVRHVCEEYLAGRYELEVVDIYQQPDLAEKAQLAVAPTLIRRSPAPLRRITGDLSSVEQLLAALEQRPPGAAEGGS